MTRTARQDAPPSPAVTRHARELPSGRSVVVRVGEGAEEVELRSPDGAVEVTITLGPGGPLVRLAGARLEIDAQSSVDLRCRDFRLSASGREMRMDAREDMRLDGGRILLNCDEM